MGRSQKWPDLRSPISKIRDIRFVGTDELIIFWKFHNFPWNIVAVARLESYFVVGSLDLTWWPDLTWHWVEIFTKVAEKMGSKVGENAPPPPAGRGLTRAPLGSGDQRARLGGGHFAPPPQISREPRNVTTSGKRRWIALVVNSPKRINFSKIEVTGQVKLRSNAKSYCFWLWRRLRPNKAL